MLQHFDNASPVLQCRTYSMPSTIISHTLTNLFNYAPLLYNGSTKVPAMFDEVGFTLAQIRRLYNVKRNTHRTVHNDQEASEC